METEFLLFVVVATLVVIFFERFYSAMLESQAAGMLFIVSDGEGLRENVLHNETAWEASKLNLLILANQLHALAFMDSEYKLRVTVGVRARIFQKISFVQRPGEFELFCSQDK